LYKIVYLTYNKLYIAIESSSQIFENEIAAVTTTERLESVEL